MKDEMVKQLHWQMTTKWLQRSLWGDDGPQTTDHGRRPQYTKAPGLIPLSLSVDRSNYAVRMYQRAGFVNIDDESDDHWTMVLHLSEGMGRFR